MRAASTFELRVGARVLLLANVDVAAGLANGSTGTIVGFDASSSLPYVDFDDLGVVLVHPHQWRCEDVDWQATYEQVPLMLAWATSIHRSQGLTLRTVVADVSVRSCFAPGMAYVVASRVRSLDSLHLRANFSSGAIFADAEVIAFYNTVH